MSREARKISESNIYHVVHRGIDHRNIFIEDSDYIKFKNYLLKAVEKHKGKIYAYCLMTNHVHLLIETAEDKTIGDFIRSIAIGYVQYHNNKYGRTGHLFQNRFLSEAVESDKYLMTVQRYIHQNPYKANMIKHLEDYKWSSYNEYFNKKKEICDIDFLLEIYDSHNQFIEFTNMKNEDNVLESSYKLKATDAEIIKIVSENFDLNKILKATTIERSSELRRIMELTNASGRQLGRVLGIGRGIIGRL